MKSPKRNRAAIALILPCLIALAIMRMAVTDGRAAISPGGLLPVPDGDRIQLIHADEWDYDEYVAPDAQRLSGNVQFLHRGMRLKCDSAVYFEQANAFKAFGHVVMTQGDTLSLASERMAYYGDEQMAEARCDVVLTHRDQTLYTDSLNYDRLYKYAYFFDGGRLVEGDNVLTSDWGEYHTDTRQSTFVYEVRLTNPQFRIETDTLHYNTLDKWTIVRGPSWIFSDDNEIETSFARYNTATKQAQLFDRSVCHNRGSRMTGDSLYYNKETGIMEAFRNVEYQDSTSKSILTGDYAWYDEHTGEALAYGRALARDYSNGTDTLYVHADTLRMRSYDLGTDSVYRVLRGYFHARAYRTDVQAVADSLVYHSADRKLSLYRDPIVWSENRQIVGEEIHVYANDSTIDSVYVCQQAMLVEQVDSVHYNQVTGNLMRSYFEAGEMRLNCVDGNVYVANFPLEKDSIVLYQNYTETAKLRMYMRDKRMQRIWAPGSRGSFYVAALTPEEHRRLTGFAWFDYIRPLHKDDLFEWRPKRGGSELKPQVRHKAPVQTLGKQ